MPVEAIGLEDLGHRMRGPVGSRVRLAVAPPAGGEKTYDLRRERVIPNVVNSRYENGVAILEVSRFNVATAQNVEQAIRQAKEALGPAAKGMIIDLSGNPGGLQIGRAHV